jgi:hypothetical protein
VIWNQNAKDINKKSKQKRIKERRKNRKEKDFGPRQPVWPSTNKAHGPPSSLPNCYSMHPLFP